MLLLASLALSSSSALVNAGPVTLDRDFLLLASAAYAQGPLLLLKLIYAYFAPRHEMFKPSLFDICKIKTQKLKSRLELEDLSDLNCSSGDRRLNLLLSLCVAEG